MQISRIIKISATSLAAMILLFGCGQNDTASESQIETIKERFPDAAQTDSGLRYIVTQAGEGETPKKGDTVTAHYTGRLLNGKEFDSSVGRAPFSFRVGIGQVIRGWDEAFLDMKKGEKRTLIIPPNLAYGDRATGPIPANSYLIFEVELIDFK